MPVGSFFSRSSVSPVQVGEFRLTSSNISSGLLTGGKVVLVDLLAEIRVKTPILHRFARRGDRLVAPDDLTLRPVLGAGALKRHACRE